jgi:Pyruvate/2-oxoacid:ferredoxin oxidoreductase gamma subunit
MMTLRSNFVVVGQSGQGSILVSKILVSAFHQAGQAVVATEYPAITHRFAITYAHIRIGRADASPRIRPREADLIVGLEPFESLRAALLFANPQTVVVTNDNFLRIDGEPNHLLKDPVVIDSVSAVVDTLATRGIARVVPLAGTTLAFQTLKNRAAANMVILGGAFASGRLPLDQAALERVIVELAPRGTGERNRDAFRAGLAAFREIAGDRDWVAETRA